MFHLPSDDIPPMTESEAHTAIEECLIEEKRMSEYPRIMALFNWYRAQEEQEFTLDYALRTTLRFIQKTTPIRPKTRKWKRHEKL